MLSYTEKLRSSSASLRFTHLLECILDLRFLRSLELRYRYLC